MISYIKGTLEYIFDDYIIVINNNIGYQIKASKGVIERLPILHSEVEIFTYLYVREDDLSLFGFLSLSELELFKILISVNGIGPKAATSILSVLSVDDLKMAILSGDVKTISKAQGVGTKGAQRIVMELKDKIKIEDMFKNNSFDNEADTSQGNGIKAEVILALTNLGYTNSEALRAINKVENAIDLDTEALLKEALKKIIN